MKIAVVAPCPQPFIVGGAEKLWWGLVRHLNENTVHQADIIKLPSPEADFWSLMDSYQRFSLLRLDGFDLVITGKYPAWMIEHPRHVCYMLHRLRGLYDAYPGSALAARSSYPSAIQQVLALLDSNPGQREILPELFGRLEDIAAVEGDAKAVLSFPGPISRAVVHFLDNVALDPSRIVRYASIAHTVARREDYFPKNTEVAVAHPPSNLAVAPGHDFQYFFTVSRLDGPKRVSLLIEAMRHVKTDIKLLIAGVGPEENQLNALAKDDPRINLLGFQSDAQLARLYQNALAVPFVPYQEDYGLVTVEAMLAAKAVVTVQDSGGPTELVRDGENGLVVEATPQALGRALNQLASNPAFAKSLGTQGHQDAQRITWAAVADALLDLPEPSTQSRVARPVRTPAGKLVVVVTFSIFPPRHGGQNRVYNLYRHLAAAFDIVIIALTDPHVPASDTEIAPGLREIRIPKTPDQARREAKLQERFAIPITDIAASQFYRSTPLLLDTIQKEAQDATALVACHPYLFPALAEIEGKPIWYEAQDIEFQLKGQVFASQKDGPALVAQVRELEHDCCKAAQFILTCSKEDASVLAHTFDIPSHKFIVTPNGTNCDEIQYADEIARQRFKQRLGGGKQPFVLFMGSGHHPNIEAVGEIFKIAATLPKIIFLIVGNVGYAFDPMLKPENVWLLGEITETSRKIILELADIALNPMLAGSGTNLKMLDYFAAGIPVISTATGARGLDVRDEDHLLIRPIEAMAATIESCLSQPEHMARITQTARKHVEEYFDWRAIAEKVMLSIKNAPRPSSSHGNSTDAPSGIAPTYSP